MKEKGEHRQSGASRESAWLAKLCADIRVWRWVAAVLATLSLALLVAAIIARDPPDFSDISIVAVVRDGERHPIWAIRLCWRRSSDRRRYFRGRVGSAGTRLSNVALNRGPGAGRVSSVCCRPPGASALPSRRRTRACWPAPGNSSLRSNPPAALQIPGRPGRRCFRGPMERARPNATSHPA